MNDVGRSLVEPEDMQALIAGGLGELRHAWYFPLAIKDAGLARESIRRMLDGGLVATAAADPEGLELCVNMAFTYEGLLLLRPELDRATGFSQAFREGMAADHRARLLQDEPASWEWGRKDEPVHALLVAFWKEPDRRGSWDRRPTEPVGVRKRIKDGLEGFEAVVGEPIYSYPISRKVTSPETYGKPRAGVEHFGFADGISNPTIQGMPDAPRERERQEQAKRAHAQARTPEDRGPEDAVAAGEFVLGYEDASQVLPVSPRLARKEGVEDFGRNGSYLVFRQLAQKVHEFWRFMLSRSDGAALAEAPVADDIEEYRRTAVPQAAVNGATRLAVRMIGRQPDGESLAQRPGETPVPVLDFSQDVMGATCPLGAHVRRANPQQTFLPAPFDHVKSSPEKTNADEQARLRLVGRRRLLRRSRVYGPPFVESMQIGELIAAAVQGDDLKERGLCFVCLNADLQRQFEFVQSAWVGNPCFAGMRADPDPLLAGDGAAARFTLQGPLPERVPHVLRFVEVRGGAYFFLPSMRALRSLCGAAG